MKQIIRVTFQNVDSEIESITNFYNKNFPKAQHETRYKRHMYKKNEYKAIVLIIKLGDRIVGLLESWLLPKRSNVRLFTTLLVDEGFRNQGLARQMIEKMFEIITLEKENLVTVVNFRECNKKTHVPFYEKFGFKNPVLIGKYANGDDMWEMEYK